MKRIGLTQRLVDAGTEVREALDVNWGSFVVSLGGLPVPLASSCSVESWATEALAGIVLTGGNDLAAVADSPLSRRRDSFEREVLAFAMDRGVPVLGVCRGMQFLAAEFGATVVPVSGHVAVKHQVTIPAEARWLLPGTTLEVNSFHNYGVRAVPAGFSVEAVAGDGSIEAISHRERPVFAQMWHPERDAPFSEDMMEVWRRFLGVSLGRAQEEE